MFRLAGYLGMTVGEIETRMTARELVEWELLEKIEPFGEKRADYRAALIAQQIVNVAIIKPSARKKIDAFLLEFKTERRTPIAEKPAQSADTLMSKFKRLTSGIKSP